MRMTREQAALLLGVDVDAPSEQVDQAWRVWAKLAHPDVGGDREHFEALALARFVLSRRADVSRWHPSETPVAPTTPPRAPLRDVCCRPSARGILGMALTAMGSIVAVLLAPHLSDLGAALAVGAAASAGAIAIQRNLLRRSADTGHRISVLALAWFPIAAVLAAAIVYQGVAIISFLPVVALPFVVIVGLVNPGAGLWRPVRLPS